MSQIDGNIYTDVNEEIEFCDLKQQYVDDVDSSNALPEEKLATFKMQAP